MRLVILVAIVLLASWSNHASSSGASSTTSDQPQVVQTGSSGGSFAFSFPPGDDPALPLPHEALVIDRQAERTIYTFPGSSSGSSSAGGPAGPLLVGPGGVFYGTADIGGGRCGSYPCGVVYALTPSGSGYSLSVLYSFQNYNDGYSPKGSLVADQAGELYGTTYGGGSTACIFGCGTIFKLTPTDSGTYSKSTLYSFQGKPDGSNPWAGLTKGKDGVLYGTTTSGGGGACNAGCGTVLSLTRTASGYRERVLYRFQGGSAGEIPFGGVIVDAAGTLYGTATNPGCCAGTVFRLTPTRGNSTYTEDVLYHFNGAPNGATPYAGLTFGADGSLYGTTYFGGIVSRSCSAFGCGTVFKVARTAAGYSESVLWRFNDGGGKYPTAPLTIDRKGIIYGVTAGGGRRCDSQGSYGCGVAFALIPTSSGYIERVLHRFHGADGLAPTAGLTMVASGALFGTTQSGGSAYGTAFELTP